MKIYSPEVMTEEEISESSTERLRYIYFLHLYIHGINCPCSSCKEYRKRDNPAVIAQG